MHIAWLGKKTPFCGNVTYSREVTNALLDRGHQVSFFHFAQEATQETQTLVSKWEPHSPLNGGNGWSIGGCEVSLPCLYKSTIYTIPTLKSRKVLTQALRELQPDLVHASLTLSPLDFVLPEICEELDLPLVATFHPPFAYATARRSGRQHLQHLTYQLYAPFLLHYDKTIVFSQMQREVLGKLGVPPGKVAVIPNGVDVQKYSPGYSQVKYELKAQRLFVYQGRIAMEKNVEALLKAWKQCDLGADCKLAIVGDGPLAPSLQVYAGSEDNVLWLGYVANEQQRIEILRGADVFILPSLVEGLSLSLLEAMACGLACIATDVGADGEVLSNGAGVVLNSQGVTTQLKTLLPLFRDQPELIPVLGQKARQRVLDRYTLSGNITQLENLYAEILKARLGQVSRWR
ncbi:glycosyltransferase family 4 protein [Phormidium sp. CCY1219]|uniref:glycosyltransferase family 4 protein n=1 Tax=Phormidium sp. CCY1219 TaxID=2886104 RepID=UPI002D1E560C|nr:glycosyltransferase family 4 protein [Phormidium sp. CCY1219]MEB3830417.1 glycosyltransferase family 4 protein [Phormidium sp. CCY1219]